MKKAFARTLMVLGVLPLAVALMIFARLANLFVPDPSRNFAGQTAVITGASSGLGHELAEKAVQLGMNVVLIDKNAEGSERFINSHPSAKTYFIKVDLSKPDSRVGLMKKASEAFGGIDILFNNAAYGYAALTEDVNLADAERQFEVNFWACVDLAKQALPLFRAQNSGLIVNISSILGSYPSILDTATGFYAASKHALNSWSKSLARELSGSGVRVVVVAPSGMRTQFFENIEGIERPRVYNEYLRMKDFFQEPSVIADQVFKQLATDRFVILPGQSPALAFLFSWRCLLTGADCPI